MSRRKSLSRLRLDSPTILPSLLQCNFADLQSDVTALVSAGIEALHLDVMDGHFVPNFTYGMPIVAAVRGITDKVLDVHLMIERPERYVEAFYEAGADIITVHAEACERPAEVLAQIRKLGAACGLAFNPSTPLAEIRNLLPECDLALVMSVEAGFGGQSFDEESLERVRQVRQWAPELVVEMDGGIKPANIGACASAGAELFVVGSAIFGESDYGAPIKRMRDEAALASGRDGRKRDNATNESS